MSCAVRLWRRPRSAALVAVFALAALLAGLGAWSSQAQPLTPHRGVHLHALWSNSTSSATLRELDLARRAGSTTVRLDVGWGSIEERRKGQRSGWYVARMDRFMSLAAARGMKVVVTLFGTPCWASSAPPQVKRGCTGEHWNRGVQWYAPRNPADYAGVVRWMTARYGTKLAALEVWNEPNHSDFWKSSDPAGAYAALLKAAYPAAKAGNPRVPVLGASLSGSDRGFLARLYDRGIRGSYDGLAVHAYKDPTFAQLKALRQLQLSRGDTTPVWVTEFGWPTGRSPEWHVSEQLQANYVASSFAQLAQLHWVRAAILYQLRDNGTSPWDEDENMGVLRRNFRPKPAWSRLAGALR